MKRPVVTSFAKQLARLRQSGKSHQITGFHKALAQLDGRQYPIIPEHVIANIDHDLRAIRKATTQHV